MTRIARIRPFAALAAIAIPATFLVGCAGPSVPMQPAEFAADPLCAEVTVRLPDVVNDLERRDTNAQATGAWGNPAAILLRCGVPTPPPTTDRCISINGIDWIEDASKAPTYVYTTYGRTPAAEVVLDMTQVSGTASLIDLQDAVAQLPKTGGCVGADDLDELLDGQDPNATPTAAPGD